MSTSSAVAHSAATLDRLTSNARRAAGTATTAGRDRAVGLAASQFLASLAVDYIEPLAEALDHKRREADIAHDTVVEAVHNRRRIQAQLEAATAAIALVEQLLAQGSVDQARTVIDGFHAGRGNEAWAQAAASGRASLVGLKVAA